MHRLPVTLAVATLATAGVALWPLLGAGHGPEILATEAALGEVLFFDVDLSANRTQSCAT